MPGSLFLIGWFCPADRPDRPDRFGRFGRTPVRRGAASRQTVLTALLTLVAASAAPAAVYIEDSPDAAQRARQAQEQLDAGRAGEAAALLQSVRVEFGARLMEREPGLYVDAARWVGQRLRDDPVLRAAYRKRFDAEAQRARDAAGEAADGDPPAVRAALAAVAQQYAGSGPGRDAALDLAARYIRAGRGVEAREVLDDLAGLDELNAAGLQAESLPRGNGPATPSDPAAAVRYQTLVAWAATLTGDAAGRDAALDGLTAAAGTDAAAKLDRELVPPAPSLPSDDGPVPADSDPQSHPLWRVSLAEPEPEPQKPSPYGGYSANRQAPTAPLRAVARGDLILANDIERVYALDAVSGRLRWSHRPAPANDPLDPDAVWRGGGVVQTLPDVRAVAADGDRAFAVLGAVQSIRGRRGVDPARPASVLVCLDTERGEAVWSARPGDVDEVIARASFHGTPLLTPDLVIVAARRSQVSSFQDSYLIAFDRRTGAPRWRRHLASTPGPEPRRGGGALSSVSLDAARGRLYFCDNLGAVAALDAATGAVRWLRVFDDADAGRPAFGPLAATAAPTPVRGGVLLPVNDGDRHQWPAGGRRHRA